MDGAGGRGALPEPGTACKTTSPAMSQARDRLSDGRLDCVDRTPLCYAARAAAANFLGTASR